MKIILKIARAELRNLFFSPVAWFLGVLFMVQCSIFYILPLYNLAKSQEMGMKNPKFNGFFSSLTQTVYLNPDGLFANVMTNLYLFIPLLTMGIFSREISNGSIKLLYSSPIKTRYIVLGKYLSLMIYSLMLIAIVGIFMVIGYFSIRAVDMGLLFSAALGFYLLVCAYSSIGLFMSSLTTYQIVSAIGTFIIIFILGRIGNLWQDIDFVRDITYFLSIHGRTSKMLNGLISTKDVFYFLIIVGMFLGFALVKLKSGRESKPWYVTVGKYFGVLLVSLTIGYVTSRPKMVGYLDTTVGQRNTIHPRVQKIVKGLGDDPLEVTLYTNLLGFNATLGMPQWRNLYLSSVWENYLRFKPDIQFKYEYYYDALPDNYIFKNFPGKTMEQIAKEVAKSGDYKFSMFKSPAEMKKIIDLGSENYSLVMQLKYKGRTTFLRFYPFVPWPGEEHVAAALARLQDQQIPKILFTTGNLERDLSVQGERGLSGNTIEKTSRQALINCGFDIDTISLENRDIPYDSMKIAALVLADPKTALSPVVTRRINEFIEAGGNMLILGESGKEDILNPVLQPLGVRLMKGVIVEVSKDNTPDMISPYLTRSAGNLAEEDELLALKKGDTDSLFITSESAVPIDYIENNHAFTKMPLSMTKPGSTWLKKGILVKDSVPPVLNPAEGDIKVASFVTSVALERQINNKQQRIVVAGDADFISNRFGGGRFFGRALYSWLDNNEYPIYGPVPKPKDNLLLIVPETVSRLKIIFTWILPALFALFGITILVRRKRN